MKCVIRLFCIVFSGIRSGVCVKVIVRMIVLFFVFNWLEVILSNIGKFIIRIVLVFVVVIE